jgi:hypothetical protein
MPDGRSRRWYARLAAAAGASAFVSLFAVAAPRPADAHPRVVTGRLEVRHTDDFLHRRSSIRYTLIRRGRHIGLTPGHAPALRSGTAVAVKGRWVGGRLKGSIRPLHARARAATVAAGPRKVAVILVKWSNSSPDPFTLAFGRQQVFTDPESANAFYKEDSYGDVSLIGKLRADGDVFGWYTLDPSLMDPSTFCQADPFSEAANQAAAADGFQPTGYDHIVYVMEHQSGCNFGGSADLGGKRSWINGNVYAPAVIHELGHNMGLHHANALHCSQGGTPVSIGSNCTNEEYGDPYDVMGGGTHRNNAWHLRQIGFMPQANERTVSATGTYSLKATNTRGGTQLLRVPRAAGASPPYYDVELRAPGGAFDNFDAANPAVRGVMIHTNPEPSEVTQSLLLDATPGSNAGMQDAPLPPGQTFSDGTISISLQSLSAGVAQVRVVTVPDTAPPSSPSPTATVGPGRVTLAWGAATDNVEVEGYRVLRNGVELGTTTAMAWTDTAVSPGATYSYVVQAFDAAGNKRDSAPVTAVVPSLPRADSPLPPPPFDTTRPVVRVASPARGARMRRHRVVVRATATDDSGVVRTQVWVDRRLRKSVLGAHVRWPVSLRRGRHLIVARAFDAAGNQGSSSVRVRITR